MDVYRLRSGARFAGVAVLLIALLVLGMMQKTLLGMRREMGGKSAWLGTPNGSPPPEVNLLAGGESFFGEQWQGADAGDLNEDGHEEFLLLERPRQIQKDRDVVTRVVLLSPLAPDRALVLFDSNWAKMASNLGSAAFWQPRRLAGRSIEIEALDLDLESLGFKLVASWRDREHAFQQRVTRVDRNPFASYN